MTNVTTCQLVTGHSTGPWWSDATPELATRGRRQRM